MFTQEDEAMFNRYSKQKQEELFMNLFRKIEDKGYLYGFATTVYEREERERKKVLRDGNIISVIFRK